jgi:hypothetical protein
MNKRLFVSLAMCVLGIASAAPAVAQTSTASRTIQVQVNYTGTGTVNAEHKIFVALWDTPDFSSMPVAIKSLDSKTGTVTFSNVENVPAYVTTAYDPTGKWDGESGPPPSGTSVGMLSKTPPKPDPVDVAAGKSVTVGIRFDDSTKLP